MKTHESFSRHLDGCRKCREEYKSLADTLKAMDLKTVPDPGREFWDGYWDRLEQRMKREGVLDADAPQAERGNGPRPRFRLFPGWTWAAAGAAALLVAGIFIGRQFFSRSAIVARRPLPGGQTVLPASVGQDLALRTTRYLERSKVVLLALVNFNPETKDIYGLNLSRQKQTSGELVKEAALLKKDLKGTAARQLERLVGELEMILLQIANLKSGNDLSAVEIIKAGVEGKDILFKINLNEMRRSPETGRIPTRPERKTEKSAAAA